MHPCKGTTKGTSPNLSDSPVANLKSLHLSRVGTRADEKRLPAQMTHPPTKLSLGILHK